MKNTTKQFILVFLIILLIMILTSCGKWYIRDKETGRDKLEKTNSLNKIKCPKNVY